MIGEKKWRDSERANLSSDALKGLKPGVKLNNAVMGKTARLDKGNLRPQGTSPFKHIYCTSRNLWWIAANCHPTDSPGGGTGIRSHDRYECHRPGHLQRAEGQAAGRAVMQHNSVVKFSSPSIVTQFLFTKH